MPRLLIANIGNYPRIGEQKDQQRHRRGLAHFQNHDISAHALRDVEQSVVQEVIREQIDLGLDEITDGLVTWSDPISHFCNNISGIKIQGLARYFDLNFFYRVPQIVSKPKRKNSLITPAFQFAQNSSERPVRAVLTGPFTLAAHTRSDIKPYNKLESRLKFFTEVIGTEIKELVAAGARLIQIDEPSIGLFPSQFEMFRESVQTWAEQAGSAHITLAIFYSPVHALYAKLSDLPVQSLHLDFTIEQKKMIEVVMHAPANKILSFGLFNARNTRLEPIDPILKILRDWFAKSKAETCFLSPSAGLESLPRESAIAKLKLMNKIKIEMSSSLVSHG